jgi:hypothetical protein
MKLKDTLDAYYEYSRKTSDVIRQLGLAGIALIWIFKVEAGGNQVIPDALIPAAVFIVIGLASDLLHCIYGTAAWGIYHRCKENKNTRKNAEFEAPRWINWPTNTFFVLKVISIFLAYCFILYFLFDKFI